jgi:wobble nucleotide-excising tRNase
VARVKWNPEYAPNDWKGKGQDIIVMMRRNNDSVEKVAENWDKYEKIDLDDLPIKEYDEALRFRDMILAERKKSYKPRKVETVQETSKGLKKKKEWVAPNKPIWEETINKDT